MKPVLSEADYVALHNVVSEKCAEKDFISVVLQNSKIVPEKELPAKTVRLNSIVMIWHSFLKKVVKFRIVLPDKADLGNRNISAFSPISLAVIGRRENDAVSVNIGGMTKHLKIIKVLNK